MAWNSAVTLATEGETLRPGTIGMSNYNMSNRGLSNALSGLSLINYRNSTSLVMGGWGGGGQRMRVILKSAKNRLTGSWLRSFKVTLSCQALTFSRFGACVSSLLTD